jgi:hypothetical protein
MPVSGNGNGGTHPMPASGKGTEEPDPCLLLVMEQRSQIYACVW